MGKEYWVVPKKIHTPPTEEFLPSREGGSELNEFEKNVVTFYSMSGEGDIFNFLQGDGSVWNGPFFLGPQRQTRTFSVNIQAIYQLQQYSGIGNHSFRQIALFQKKSIPHPQRKFLLSREGRSEMY